MERELEKCMGQTSMSTTVHNKQEVWSHGKRTEAGRHRHRKLVIVFVSHRIPSTAMKNIFLRGL